MSTTIIYFDFTAIYYYNCTIKNFFQAIFQLKEFSEKLFLIFTGLVADMFLSRHHFSRQAVKEKTAPRLLQMNERQAQTHMHTHPHTDMCINQRTRG